MPTHIREALLALGFVGTEDGTLTAPVGTDIAFTPIGAFIELKIALVDGATITAVLAKVALKIRHAKAMERRDG